MFVYGVYVFVCMFVFDVSVCVGVTVGFKYKEDRYPFQSALLQIETFKHSYKIYVIKHSTQQMFIIWCLYYFDQSVHNLSVF